VSRGYWARRRTRGPAPVPEPQPRGPSAPADPEGSVLSQPHRRYNPLSGEWVLVSPDRTLRPWQGRHDPRPPEDRPRHDPTCYLCPGNTRANGETNPAYAETFVFTNDFAALRPDTVARREESGLLVAEGEPGTCRVLCFSPRHDLTLGRMAHDDVRRVVDVWAGQSTELGARYAWIEVFENSGESMGASNPHPHGQVWAGSAVPEEAVREERAQERWRESHGRRLLLDYAAQEHGSPRAVVETDQWLVVVPFWAKWPFETLVIPRRPVSRLPDLQGAQRDELAAALVELLTRYDNLFELPFPYTMGWHQAPFDGRAHDGWQLHAHFYPPLLRAGMVRKFMTGYDLLSEAQRDLSPEEAAERLRAVPSVHYTNAMTGNSPRPVSPVAPRSDPD
jgi:UDPglucose--hexose-1-phosphate uridylyltransferase